MDYNEFLQSKKTVVQAQGFKIDVNDINPILFPFQKDIVKWALWKGRAAIFADCGLGKTFMQLEIGRFIRIKTGKPALIIAPLAVSGQTVKEAQKLNIDVEYCRLQADADGVLDNITNYEMIEKFNMKHYGGLILDESSILKNFTGKIKQKLIKMSKHFDYRFAFTATPAPNDHLELGNHSEFLGIMASREMIQRWFVNDSMHAGGYRLRGHGADDFWTWVSSWAVALRWPSDVGQYDDNGYILPELVFEPHIIPVDHSRAWDETDKSGQISLLITGRTSATNMHKEKRATLQKRMTKAAELAIDAAKDDFVIVWCETNAEADELRKRIPQAVEVRGNEPIDIKRQKLEDFSDCKTRILITKPKIAAHGLNWQHAGTQIWTSITHKFEPFYQGYKRSHRFGRTEPVTCHIVYAESEGDILENLNRKHEAHEEMQNAMVASMQEHGMSLEIDQRMRVFTDNSEIERGDMWTLYHGDSAVAMKDVPDNSVDFRVQSPPFESLYIYSNHVEDLGNSASNDEFYTQYGFILKEELRMAKQGSFKAEHCKDLPLYANRDGAMGLDDFPGRLIEAHLDAGWWFVGWKTIWKDPVIEMQRTKNAGLLWSSAFCQRAERARQGMADYTLVFQKPIDGEIAPVTERKAGTVNRDVVNRCIDLWTNKGEAILTPFIDDDADEYAMIFMDGIGNNSIEDIKNHLMDGRNLIVRVNDSSKMHLLIAEMKPYRMVFHSRIALTDGTWLLVFRKWVNEMPDTHVIHDLKAPKITGVETIKKTKIRNEFHDLSALANNVFDGKPLPDDAMEEYEIYKATSVKHEDCAHKFIGNRSPEHWQNDRDYSIQVWQRYASPVWFDFDGMQSTHDDIWFDIDQTNVLNHRIAREDKDEKHICPLQIDLIKKCIAMYTKKGDTVGTSFAGVGSEVVTAIEMGRYGIGCELKGSYFDLACTHARDAERIAKSPTLFDFMDSQ